jgi:hypothetical protein
MSIREARKQRFDVVKGILDEKVMGYVIIEQIYRIDEFGFRQHTGIPGKLLLIGWGKQETVFNTEFNLFQLDEFFPGWKTIELVKDEAI